MDLIEGLAQQLLQGDRLALAKAVTLIESQAEKDETAKLSLLKELKGNNASLRIAISGPPGVGKSTFINVFGQKLVNRGHRVAVLPIDPSSTINLGSILGDKARMPELMSHESVFIRPSPSRGVLGGVASSTHDVILAAETNGFDIIIIETVGIGQSESTARVLSDFFIMLMQPGAGDQVQAMKKGVLELVDAILITKADQEQESLANKTKDSLKALTLGQGTKLPYIDAVSSITDRGIKEATAHVLSCHHQWIKTRALASMRAKRREEYFKRALVEQLALTIARKLFSSKCPVNISPGPEDMSLTPDIYGLVEKYCARLN